MRIHILVAAVILIMALVLDISKGELTILCVMITIVLISEISNTAAEAVANFISPQEHPEVKIIKDIAAGAVLLTSISAVLVGCLIFLPYVYTGAESILARLRETPWHLSAISVIAIAVIAVAFKICTSQSERLRLRGGMPSLHSALAFSAWTVILFSMAETPKRVASVIVGLTFALAAMVASSRVKDNIHNLLEVLIGSLLGISITALIFHLIMRTG
jgi:diacylglycerol kinase (ATP)